MIPTAKRFNDIADPSVVNILKLGNRPDVISFAGGTPNPSTFPIQLIKQATNKVVPNLQYSEAQGNTSFRKALASRFSKKWGVSLGPENILITTGSQQALDLVARTYINPGDSIKLDDPTYFVALYAFSAYSPIYNGPNPKFHYLTPTFQNPTGNTLTDTQRQQIAQNSQLIIEDDPYSELYFDTAPPKPIYTRAPEKTIYITSVSKILGPALRLGIVVADPQIISQLTLVKTGMDLCTSGWIQDIAEKVISNPDFDNHLQTIRAYYANKCQIVLDRLQTHLSGVATWTKPQGGMFIWLTFNDQNVDTFKLYETAVQNGIAFVPGYAFRPNRQPSNSLRLSFSQPTQEQIETGIKILRDVINK